jgi:hypothetical protein
MNKIRLFACPACSRHVRASERDCPFCAAAIPRSWGDAPAPRPPRARLSRAALYAFGATSVGLAAACGGVSGGPGDAGDEGVSEAESEIRAQPAYGCFPPECGGVPDAARDQGSPPGEAGGPEASDDGGTDNDGQSDEDVRGTAAYGAFPSDGGVHR